MVDLPRSPRTRRIKRSVAGSPRSVKSPRGRKKKQKLPDLWNLKPTIPKVKPLFAGRKKHRGRSPARKRGAPPDPLPSPYAASPPRRNQFKTIRPKKNSRKKAMGSPRRPKPSPRSPRKPHSPELRNLESGDDLRIEAIARLLEREVDRFPKDLGDQIETTFARPRLSITPVSPEPTRADDADTKETLYKHQMRRLYHSVEHYRAVVASVSQQMVKKIEEAESETNITRESLSLANVTVLHKDEMIQRLVKKRLQDAKELSEVAAELVSNSRRTYDGELVQYGQLQERLKRREAEVERLTIELSKCRDRPRAREHSTTKSLAVKCHRAIDLASTLQTTVLKQAVRHIETVNTIVSQHTNLDPTEQHVNTIVSQHTNLDPTEQHKDSLAVLLQKRQVTVEQTSQTAMQISEDLARGKEELESIKKCQADVMKSGDKSLLFSTIKELQSTCNLIAEILEKVSDTTVTARNALGGLLRRRSQSAAMPPQSDFLPHGPAGLATAKQVKRPRVRASSAPAKSVVVDMSAPNAFREKTSPMARRWSCDSARRGSFDARRHSNLFTVAELDFADDEESSVFPRSDDEDSTDPPTFPRDSMFTQPRYTNYKEDDHISIEEISFERASLEEHDAASKIQSLYRGKAARRELEAQNRAAVKIQAVQRGKAVRKRMEHTESKAVKNTHAGLIGFAQEFNEGGNEETDAMLQEWINPAFASQDEIEAAIKIQAIRRGIAVRTQIREDGGIVTHKPTGDWSTPTQPLASSAIGSRRPTPFVGVNSKHETKRGRSTTRSIPEGTVEMDFGSEEAVDAATENRGQPGTFPYRGRQARREIQRESDAAVKIQSIQRPSDNAEALSGGRMARRQQSEAAVGVKFTRRTMPTRKEGADPTEEEIAATKIQAVHRGRKARKELKQESDAATKIQAIQRGRQARREMKQESDAAVKIQAIQRPSDNAEALSSGRQARRELEQESDAAVKIQAIQRGRAARREMKNESEAAVKIQAIQRGRVARREMKEESEAAVKIQAIQRGRAARREMKNESEAAVKIQAIQRGRIARREMKNESEAAVKIQAIQRGRKARKELKENPETADTLQLEKGREMRKELQKETEAATKIQAVHRPVDNAEALSRGRETRKELRKEADAATKIQAVHRPGDNAEALSRGREARKELQEEADAATKIQAVHRGRMTRKNLGKTENADEAETEDPEAGEARLYQERRRKQELAAGKERLEVPRRTKRTASGGDTKTESPDDENAPAERKKERAKAVFCGDERPATINSGDAGQTKERAKPVFCGDERPATWHDESSRGTRGGEISDDYVVVEAKKTDGAENKPKVIADVENNGETALPDHGETREGAEETN